MLSLPLTRKVRRSRCHEMEFIFKFYSFFVLRKIHFCSQHFAIFLDASGHYWTGSEQDRVTAAHVEWNVVLQTMKCVSAATSRRCHISLIPARWPNSTVAYSVYTLLTRGWHGSGESGSTAVTTVIKNEKLDCKHVCSWKPMVTLLNTCFYYSGLHNKNSIQNTKCRKICKTKRSE